MRKTRYLFSLGILLLFIGYNLWQSQTKSITSSVSPTPSPVQPTAQATVTPIVSQVLGEETVQKSDFVPVVKVSDGDTFSVEIDGVRETVRLIGIDTPEVVDPRKPVQCFGKEASQKAKEILTGKKVRLEADSTQSNKDRYGRILRYAYLEDGTFFNKFMIEEGFAFEYTYQNDPYQFQDEFKTAESLAREKGKGLWAENVCPK